MPDRSRVEGKRLIFGMLHPSTAVGMSIAQRRSKLTRFSSRLRRDPDVDGFNARLRVLDADAQDYRTMRTLVHGFEPSAEHRLCFGQS